MKVILLLSISSILLFGVGCFGRGALQENKDIAPVIDRGSILNEARQNGLIMDEQEILAMAYISPSLDPDGRNPLDISAYLKTDMEDWRGAALADVTGGGSYGIAHASIQTSSFTLIAQMGNLPDPAYEYYYEGWLVRRGDPLAAFSLGRAQKTENGYVIVYLTSADFSDHDFFVLTLEPNDDNLAPAEHILEGAFR